jgi:hypothetical protein
MPKTEARLKAKFSGFGGLRTYFTWRRGMNLNLASNVHLPEPRIPDSRLVRAITELVRDTESPLPFQHSSRVYYWGALAGKRRGLRFDPELLYAGAMFDDMGLTH